MEHLSSFDMVSSSSLSLDHPEPYSAKFYGECINTKAESRHGAATRADALVFDSATLSHKSFKQPGDCDRTMHIVSPKTLQIVPQLSTP
jgi:hypothetical protein